MLVAYCKTSMLYYGHVQRSLENDMHDTKHLKEFIKANGNKFFTVEFVKKDGSLRTINGHIRPVPGHDGINPTAHIDKYLTVVLAEKDSNGKEQFRNVNLETIKRISIAGKVYRF